MQIIVNQTEGKVIVEFRCRGLVDKYVLDRADYLLLAIDKFTKKRKIDLTLFRGARLEIKQASLLTERIIRSILQAILWQK